MLRKSHSNPGAAMDMVDGVDVVDAAHPPHPQPPLRGGEGAISPFTLHPSHFTPSPSHPHDPPRISRQNVLQRPLIRHQPVQSLQALRSAALLAGPDMVVAVAAEHELFAMPHQ